MDPTRPEPPSFLAKQHVLFALRHAKFLPTPYQAEDNNRMTLAYFCLASLALLPSSAVSTTDPTLSALDVMLKPAQKQGFRDWVYEQQMSGGGFRGSDSLAAASSPERGAGRDQEQGNVIQTYTAMLVLGLLGDDFERLDRAALKRFLRECQNQDGSFSLFPGCEEAADPRSSYSAFAVASMLDEWECIDVERGLAFLECCRSYEGAYAQRPGLEANAGPTYCAIAAYSLASRLHTISQPDRLLRWLVDRQVEPPLPSHSETDSDSDGLSESRLSESVHDGIAAPPLKESLPSPAPQHRSDPPGSQFPLPNLAISSAGFQGRANKPTDACYSFWNVAALSILIPSISPHLSLKDLVDPSLDRQWLLSCQHPLYGGIAREPKAQPDVYHTYLSLAALALGDADSRELDLARLDAAWNVPQNVATRIRSNLWKDA
ncbi:hypothetical protein BMF94_5161 [Rhodotorula taiwanensis]|uniref:Prenyltransferase alpha-alpha toroid domain-containing protein n=1 Tax=Rhodotorula taiwanensis TaxID=741276 RepID=A0A2S5B4U3_9BASI|nr:hypothetical protein BMF94_5161 [Rhodotorula taiwanensis]